MSRRACIAEQQRHAREHSAAIRPLHKAIRQLVAKGHRDITLHRSGEAKDWHVSSNDQADRTLRRQPDYQKVADAFFDAATRALQPDSWNGKVRIAKTIKRNGHGWHVLLIDPVSSHRIEQHFRTPLPIL